MGTSRLYGIYAAGNGTALEIASSPWYSYKTKICPAVLKEGITRIGDYAFAYCDNIVGVVEIPQSVTEIGTAAFYDCQNLGELVFSNVSELGKNSFGDCKSLEKVELPASVAKLGFQAFANCTGLQVFTFEGVRPGTYKLAVYKTSKYVPQIVEVTIGEENIALGEVNLWAYGDVNGDGKVNTLDVGRINAHVKQTNLIW